MDTKKDKDDLDDKKFSFMNFSANLKLIFVALAILIIVVSKCS